jgi:flagellar biosynthesis/type III secretory pathway protein FliH
MRNMSFPPDSQKKRGQPHSSAFNATSGPGNNVEQLLKEIEEREKYIKQITDKSDGLEKEAYEKGFAQGEKAGMELGEKRFDSIVKSFSEVLEFLGRLKEESYQKNEQDMIELVLAIARRIIQKEVSADGSIISRMISSALKYVTDQERIKVKLNPSDLEFAGQYRGEMIKEMGGMKNITFESDEGIVRGDAVIESNRGIIDAGIGKHLQEVEKALREQAEENAQKTQMAGDEEKEIARVDAEEAGESEGEGKEGGEGN